MKSHLALILYAATTLLMSACASAPDSKAGATLAVAPANVTSNTPEWFFDPPEPAAEFVYVVGTAISRDISMSGHKAQLDAETHLANRIAGEINTLTKDYKREVGDEFVQSTEIVANKIATDVKIIGGDIVKKQVTPEGGGFRTYVLLKFPLGTNSQMLQNHLNKTIFKGAQEAGERELRQRTEQRRSGAEHPMASHQSTVGPVDDGSGIVIRETLATSTSRPLGLADKEEED